MQSKAQTVTEYLKELPDDRREAINQVRRMILDNIDDQIVEGMQYGMIGYFIPHSIYPAGYHCDPKQPLPFACLASQKNYMSLYLMCLYSDASGEKVFRDKWAKTGKKLDMGKSCIRFKRVEDLALDIIAEAIRNMPSQKWIKFYEAVLSAPREKGPAKKAAAKKATTKKAATKKAATKKLQRGK